MKKYLYLLTIPVLVLNASCNKDDSGYLPIASDPYANIKAAFGDNINPEALHNYAAQQVPGYILKDNSAGNSVTDKGATLGRVLFYDKNLSSNNTISCSSCHMQQHAFSDPSIASTGVNGSTGRHSMRLINARFAAERRFFWDERASTLEEQATMPVKDHAEMGFSGTNGDQTFEDLIIKLNKIGYYKELFKFVYGSEEITEEKIQLALAQFVRSIQSFDSKYDIGRAQAPDSHDFPNFTAQENLGKKLFMTPADFNAAGERTRGGAGCASCHRAPEFDINPFLRNNGVITTIVGNVQDFNNTRSPSLRDLFNTEGALNSPLMHTGEFSTLEDVILHYNDLTASNNEALDHLLAPNGLPQKLNLTDEEINALVAFLKTLSGSDVYTNPKWSDPFLH